MMTPPQTRGLNQILSSLYLRTQIDLQREYYSKGMRNLKLAWPQTTKFLRAHMDSREI